MTTQLKDPELQAKWIELEDAGYTIDHIHTFNRFVVNRATGKKVDFVCSGDTICEAVRKAARHYWEHTA